MTDFLDFLNHAELDKLTQLPGITRQIGMNIIAARPFEAVNDCLKAKGMGKGLLAKIQAAFEAETSASENGSMSKVEEDAARVEESQPKRESENGDHPNFLTRLGRAFSIFIKALFRLIALAAFIALIGAGVYYGLPFVNDNVIKPIERNSADVQELQGQVDELNNRVTALETSIEAHSASLGKLDEIQKTLESEIQSTQDETLIALEREVQLTRALDLLGRGRLYLAQSNFGLAKSDIQKARDILAGLRNEENSALFDQVLVRLDLALGNLPSFGVVASNDLEIAWELLMSGVPANVITETPTPFVEPVLTATPTPFDAPTITPTP